MALSVKVSIDVVLAVVVVLWVVVVVDDVVGLGGTVMLLWLWLLLAICNI